jgi:transcriptional regulator with XRE-family HTH domain
MDVRNDGSWLRAQFGRRLRYMRRLRDLTQDQLAEAAGLSVDQISNIERGVNAPSFASLERLAAALDVSVENLFDFGASGSSAV